MRRVLAASLVLIALVLTMTSLSRDGGDPVAVARSLRLLTPDEVGAGQAFTVTVSGLQAAGGEVQLMAVSGPAVLKVAVDEPSAASATFEIGADALTTAGSVTLLARQGTAVGSQTFSVTPQSAVDPLTPLVGPRSVVADGTRRTMVVALPHDRYGNAVAAGTPIDFRFWLPDGNQSVIQDLTRRLLASVTILSGTTSGTSTVSVATGDARGPTRQYREVAGPPVGIALARTSSEPLVANGWSQVELRTEPLLDAYGNLLADGTHVRFEVLGPDGPGLVTGVVIDGRARATLTAPTRPGTLQVRASVGGAISALVDLDFDSAAASVPVDVNWSEGRPVVAVGPVIARRGGYVPDGTVATVTFRRHGRSTVRRVPLQDARATVPGPRDETARTWEIEVEVGGRATSRLVRRPV